MALTYLALALLSAAALAFEISLTRLFSVTQWYHFAFLAVSVALLGYGASGTALSLVPRWAKPPTSRRASILALLFAASVVGAYLVLNTLPFDSYRIAWERIQIVYLILTYLALTSPFFCAGLVTGLLLVAHPNRSARVYAANLLGAALGGLLPVLILPLTGEGIVLVIAALGLVAALVFQLQDHRRARQPATSPRRLVVYAALLAACCLLLALSWRLPSGLTLRLSPYKSLSQVLRFPDADLVSQRWNAFSRVDRVASSAIRSAPGLSLSCPDDLPAQDGLFVDGGDLSPVAHPGTMENLARCLPVALPYQLRAGGQALVLEPRGGLDLVVALSQGAESVVAVESNPLLVEAAGEIYRDERVEVVAQDGRSYARHSEELYDLIHLALSDSYRPVSSGAYSLGERYDLTVEAFEDYMTGLRPGGLLVIERWLQLPPSELPRAGAAAIEALRRAGAEDPASRVAVLRDWQVGLILIKSGALNPSELVAIRDFAAAQDLDLVALPGLSREEANQINILQEPFFYDAFRQLLDDPRPLYANHPYDVRPATDNRPFFFHFFRWNQTATILEQLGKTWQPWGGSGYFVLVALLAVALVTSAFLIILPLVLSTKRNKDRATGQIRGRVLLYFGLLGLGFLLVEIPLLQRFILFLGQPIYAFTAVVVSILLFSGLGSLASARLSVRWTLPLLVAAILGYPLYLPTLFQSLLGTPLVLRLLVTGLILAPVGFLMGTAFPGGLAWLRERAPDLIPWAWAINGCMSVLASILAAMIALSAGFSWVLVLGALAYSGAWLAIYQSPAEP